MVIGVLAIPSCNLGLHAMSKVIYIGRLASVPSGISSFFTQIKIEFTVYVHLKLFGLNQSDSFLRTSVFYFFVARPSCSPVY